MADIKQQCDFCTKAATRDGKTRIGPWAFMCEEHFKQLGINMPGMFSMLDNDCVPKKRCTVCGIEKPITDFYKYMDAHGVERYRSECKVCNLKRRKKNVIHKA